ncbi:MAG: XTP/dITP diphosphatase [Lachnospiraceae bacterium]|nr:XTP/dITP diphosphatase [Lachnospiraceae bacterium]
MTKIIFATGNQGKMREIKQIMKDMDVEVVSMKEAGIFTDIEENGTTFEENALIKARAIAGEAKAIVLADDSGLEIDFLDKAPGVLSARYLGEDTPYEVKNAHILELLKNVPKSERSARFVCSIAAVFPDGREFTTYSTIEGEIAPKSAGENGFGYDPIFFVPEFGKTTAELSAEEKNKISHRGKALTMMKDILKKEI